MTLTFFLNEILIKRVSHKDTSSRDVPVLYYSCHIKIKIIITLNTNRKILKRKTGNKDRPMEKSMD